MFLALALLQAAAVQPDIEFHASVRARSLTIEQKGEASLTVTTDPPGTSVVDVRAPRANGRKTIRNPAITVRIEARIANPHRQQETASGE
jgi:hypothetical protein